MTKNSKTIVSNNLYIIKILLKVSKGRIPFEVMFHASKGGVQTLIYTYLFGSIVNNIQNNKPYQEIFLLIMIVAMITAFALLFQSWFTNIYLPYSNLKIEKSCLMDVYLHSTEIDIRKYEDPNFYDSYVKALSEASNRCINLSGLIGEFFGTLFTVCYLLYIIISTEYVLVAYSDLSGRQFRRHPDSDSENIRTVVGHLYSTIIKENFQEYECI